MAPERRVFIAGSTGATGRSVTRLAIQHAVPFVAHQRPGKDRPPADAAAVFDLGDAALLTAALRGCTTVLQLIGTVRSRFSTGDTYETSDVGTTRQLVEAARQAATVDHVVLLSSVGAGRPLGAYLRAKAEAERLVRQSGLPFTVLRPSAFIGDRHRVPGLATALTRMLGLTRYQPIALEDLAAALLHVCRTRAPLEGVLEGESLWQVVEAARAAAPTGR